MKGGDQDRWALLDRRLASASRGTTPSLRGERHSAPPLLRRKLSRPESCPCLIDIWTVGQGSCSRDFEVQRTATSVRLYMGPGKDW